MTKRAHFILWKEDGATVQAFATLFVCEYMRLHGVPEEIVSDRDSHFISDFWATVMAAWDSKILTSISFHPQTDGQTEKANDVVGTYLKSFCVHDPLHWDASLPLAEFMYNV